MQYRDIGLSTDKSNMKQKAQYLLTQFKFIYIVINNLDKRRCAIRTHFS